MSDELSLNNVVTISVSETPAGVGEYNTSNVALFTREDYNESFGDLGYKIYLGPTEVGEDFGTTSETFKMANGIFSQRPNILANNGYLVVILFEDTPDVTAVQKISFSAVPASGNFKLNFNADVTANIPYNATFGTVQTAVRTLDGLAAAVVTGDFTSGFVVTFTGWLGPADLLTVTDDSLQTSEPENVSISVETTTPGTQDSTETLAAAINRTVGLVQYFGILAAELTDSGDMQDAAAVVEPLNKIAFFVARTQASVEEGGQLDLLRSGGFSHSRGLYYGGTTDSQALVMMASYAGRGLSTNFSGSNTTQTMHLKDLAGVQPDPTMTQTILLLCENAGADVYASFQGVPKVFCSGANNFFDQVYNLGWFIGALQVAGFNFLAQSSTKVPQTENGMSALKNAYRQVCELAVTNQYSAPGTWNSSTTFGRLDDFISNIEQRGYYIYSVPVAQQSQAEREAREAPLVQIALKEAGAIHSSTVLVNINA